MNEYEARKLMSRAIDESNLPIEYIGTGEQTEHARMVEAFARLAGQEVPDHLVQPTREEKVLSALLILEEALETIDALGMAIKFDLGDRKVIIKRPDDLSVHEKGEVDHVGLADGVADLSVVAIRAAMMAGIKWTHDIEEEVDRNNLLKFREDSDGYTHPDTGKWMKPSNHPVPRIKDILDKQEAIYGRRGEDYATPAPDLT